MGLGSSEPKRTIYYLGMKGTKDKKLNPHFKTQKRENGVTVDMADETAVSGYLTKIGHKKYEYPKDSGKMVDCVELYLLDGQSVYKVETSINTNLARGLMNKIIGINNWEWVTLRLFAKNEFANLFVGNNDEPMGWKFDYKKNLEPLTWKVQDPQGKEGDMITIYTKVNALLLEEWTKCESLVAQNSRSNSKIAAAIKKVSPVGAPAAPTPAPAPGTSAADTEKALFGDDAKKEADNLKKEDFDDPGPSDEPFIGGASSGSDDLPF